MPSPGHCGQNTEYYSLLWVSCRKGQSVGGFPKTDNIHALIQHCILNEKS